jgi:hypothetical protein
MPGIQKHRGKSAGDIDHLKKLKEVFLSFLGDEDIKIVLFGSRARGDSVNTSDIDVGIIMGKDADRKKLVLLREYIDEMNIPYKVEVIDLSTVSEEFKKMVLKEAVIWKD